jgi:hypothetical protein
MTGPGKYDRLCTAAREASGAQAIILIVLGGTHGSGFSCQCSDQIGRELPAMLREVADSIERDLC